MFTKSRLVLDTNGDVNVNVDVFPALDNVMPS